MALHKTVIEVEVLWDDEISNNPSDMELSNIAYQMRDGSYSGITRVRSHKTLTKKQMAKALIKQGSDPEFLDC